MRAAVVTKDHKVSIEDKKLRALKPGGSIGTNGILWRLSYRFTC